MEIKINMNSKPTGNDQHNDQQVVLRECIADIGVVKTSMAKEKDAASQAHNHEAIKAIFSDIDKLIGLNEVKGMIHEIHAYTEIQRKRQEEHLNSADTVLHAIFRGNPGSGKTTMARLLACLYKEMGILSKGHLVEVERADLVGEFIGHTAKKTKDQVKKALGGLLFIDEAYSLCRGGEKDFGREAIDALVKAMEDHKDDFVLVLAGYNREMDMFLRSNPGLHSRFPLHINFPDCSRQELLAIAEHMYSHREYRTDESAEKELNRFLLSQMAEKTSLPGNARTIRNIVEASLRTQAVRLMQNPIQTQFSRQELQEITFVDMEQAIRRLPIVKRTQMAKNNLAVLP